jgi:lysophospholipase L1-like esterase
VARELRARNDLFAEVLAERGVPAVDVLDISLGAASDRSLVARDGLHPSGAQYALWVDRIEPVVRRLLLAAVPGAAARDPRTPG